MKHKTRLSLFNNSWYKPGKGFLVLIIWFFVNACLIKTAHPFSFLRIFLLRLFGAKIGEGVVIKPNVNVKYPWRLKIGKDVWIGENVWIDNLDDVSIADNVCISQGALLLSGNHNYKKQSFDLMIAPIIIEEGVWIGAKSVVTGGTICKSHAVLSVASVAPKLLESYWVYQGNPAIKIRERIIEE